MKSLSLVLFSVFTQASVGLVLITSMLHLLHFPGLVSVALPAKLAFPLAVFGMAASLAHLGTPGGALRALTNLRTSWLSREVAATALFTAAAGLYGWVWPGRIWGLIASAAGLCAIYAQGMVYQLPTRPEWRHWANVWNGYPAAFKLGALTVALVIKSSQPLVFLGLVILGACASLLVGLATYVASLAQSSPHTARLLLGDTWFWVRLVSGLVLPAFAGMALAMGLTPDVLTTGGALVAAIVGELLGRNLFYRSVLDQLPLF